MEESKEGTIAGIGGNPMSGLYSVIFTDGSSCLIESGFGMRQLAGVLGEPLKGKKIRYSVDWLGVMSSFEPIEEGE